MSRWFRFYEEAVNDPKVLRLSDELYRAWTVLLCLTSKNDGKLPPADDIALALRIKVAKVCEWMTKLHAGGLLDKTETGFQPHNWNGRQYKSDVSTDRVKRFRNGKRNVSETAGETKSETAPEQKQITEQNRADTDARDDLKKRTGDFMQAIVQAFAAGNSPNLPETSRAGLWLSQGYQEDICLAVITDIVKRKPNITTLSYFDKPIADAHASKAPARMAVPMIAQEIDWDAVLTSYKKFGAWSKYAGPGLDSPECRAPREMLAKYGLLPPDAPLNAPAIPRHHSMQGNA
jgi:hypothetical protein